MYASFYIFVEFPELPNTITIKATLEMALENVTEANFAALEEPMKEAFSKSLGVAKTDIYNLTLINSASRSTAMAKIEAYIVASDDTIKDSILDVMKNATFVEGLNANIQSEIESNPNLEGIGITITKKPDVEIVTGNSNLLHIHFFLVILAYTIVNPKLFLFKFKISVALTTTSTTTTISSTTTIIDTTTTTSTTHTTIATTTATATIPTTMTSTVAETTTADLGPCGDFQPTQMTAVNETIPRVNTTIIFSPGYPGVYPNSASCSWMISAAEGQIVQLTFLEFDLEYK